MLDPLRQLASLPHAVVVLAPGQTVAAANPAAEQLLGQSFRRFEGRPLGELLVFDEERLAERLAETDAQLSARATGIRVLGQGPRRVDVTVAPVIDQPGWQVLTIHDIGGAEAMRETQSSGEDSMLRAPEVLAHEIKNPLAGISGAAQLLSMNLPPEDQEMTDLIVEETRRIVKLLEQVEQFGNLRPPERRAINIHDALDRARRSAQIGFARHMMFVEDYDPSLPATHADPDQLMQVFLNLIKNAAEANPRGGTIRLHSFYDLSLRIRRKDGVSAALPLQIEIIDDGPGIKPEIAANIFEPFVSGRENGTGLGLALVSKIISDHEGWISVDSAPGRTLFRVSLPMAPRPKKEPV